MRIWRKKWGDSTMQDRDSTDSTKMHSKGRDFLDIKGQGKYLHWYMINVIWYVYLLYNIDNYVWYMGVSENVVHRRFMAILTGKMMINQ